MNQLHDVPGNHQITESVAAVAAGSTMAVDVAVVPFRAVVTEVYFVPSAAITGHDTDKFTLTLTNRGAAGAGTAAVAALEFAAGVNGVAHDAKALTVSTSLDEVAEGDVLSLDKANAGSGLALPAGLVVVVLRAR